MKTLNRLASLTELSTLDQEMDMGYCMKTLNDYQNAITELETAFDDIVAAMKLINRVRLDIIDEPMDSYTILQNHFDETNRLLLSTVGCETSCYTKQGNMNFRAWHDYCHVTHRRGFDTDSELFIVGEQYKMLADMGLSDEALHIFQADTVGQVLYYAKHKEFVKDQQRFIKECLMLGIDRAVQLKQ